MFNYTWRLLATAISFALFGVGGLLISLVAIPIGFLMTGVGRERFAKRVVHYTFRLFTGTMRVLGLQTFSGDDLHLLRLPGQIVIANHPTLIDVVYLIAMIPNADCIVKSRLLANPFMRGSIRFAGYIANDDPEQVIELAAASLAAGNSLIIFPEGTRSRRRQPLSFLRGAANIAVRTKSDLRPVVISCNPLTLGKDEKWYQIPEKPFHYHLSVRSIMSIDPFLNDEYTVSARKLTHNLQSYFTAESNWNETTGT